MLLLTVAWCLGCPVMTPPPPVDSGTPVVEHRPPCLEVLPAEIDFGEVESSSGGFRVVEVRNHTRVLQVVRSTPPPFPFNVSPPLQVLDMPIPGLGSRKIELQFLPTDGLLHLGSIELNGGSDCTVTIPLRGLGSGSVQFTPQILDYGFVQPGQQKTLEVQLLNTRRAAVWISALRLHSLQGQLSFTGNLPSQLELPPVSSTSFSITASPFDGFFRAELSALTGAGEVRADLRVVGGVPVAEISPPDIRVPMVGLALGSPGAPNFSERVVRVRNVGTAMTTAAALIGVSPFARVESADGGAIDELTFAVPLGLNSGMGPGESGEFVLRLTPTAVGPRSYRVRILTNDPVRPEQVVTFEANVEPLPPCTFRVQPETELFLTATPDGLSHGTISVINDGLTRCVVDDVRLSAESPATFTLLNTETQFVVEPGETGTISIEGPRTLLANSGWVGFHVFNPDGARRLIRVYAPP